MVLDILNLNLESFAYPYIPNLITNHLLTYSQLIDYNYDDDEDDD